MPPPPGLPKSVESTPGDIAVQSDGLEKDSKDSKTGKRRFLGFGKKKDDKSDQDTMEKSSTGTLPPVRTPSPAKGTPDLRPSQAQPIPVSPSRHPVVAASPSRLRSSSPRIASPASSEIFERNVQEPVPIAALQGEDTPAAHLPTHVITEDHIPPALEASAQAITSEQLNPDEVEIVMSASHQPAASGIEGSSSHADLTQLNSPMAPLQQVRSEDSKPASLQHSTAGLPADDDGASNYAHLDPNDVRRLSFISFADVVQSEHQAPPGSALSEAGNRDSLHIASLPGSLKQERAASPLRSGRVTTPPPGPSTLNTAEQISPGRSTTGVASPVSPTNELTIETMRQAVRKTASGDLSAGRSTGMSPVSDENLPSAPRSRTNS